MEKYEHPKYSKEDIEWQKSVIKWFQDKNIPVEENEEFFIYPLTYKDGEAVKIHTPKRQSIELRREDRKSKLVETEALIAAQIEFAPEYTRENFSLVEAYKRYLQKHGLDKDNKKKK